jgi:uncharacterized protein (DUF488 family)
VELFTIGYEGRAIGEFCDMLVQHHIEVVADIRRLPLSHKPGFSKSRLRSALQDRGIEYMHLPALGSPKTLRDALRATQDYDQFFSDYAECLAKEEEGLYELEQLLGQRRRICLLCVERAHNRCHRSIVSRALTDRRGMEVVHL